MEREITWTCRCGHALTLKHRKFAWEVAECPYCKKTYLVDHMTALSMELRTKVFDCFDAFYIDGHSNILSAPATIFIFDARIHVILGESDNIIQLDILYDAIQSVNILQEREITALRTFLVGPVLAAWLKKKTQILAIGYPDNLGLIQTPTFKMENDEIKKCYDVIMAQILKLRNSETNDCPWVITRDA